MMDIASLSVFATVGSTTDKTIVGNDEMVTGSVVFYMRLSISLNNNKLNE